MHHARFSIGRVARVALVAAGAAALSECSSAPVPFYGAACSPDPDACIVPPYDASTKDAGSDAKTDAADAAADAATD